MSGIFQVRRPDFGQQIRTKRGLKPGSPIKVCSGHRYSSEVFRAIVLGVNKKSVVVLQRYWTNPPSYCVETKSLINYNVLPKRIGKKNFWHPPTNHLIRFRRARLTEKETKAILDLHQKEISLEQIEAFPFVDKIKAILG